MAASQSPPSQRYFRRVIRRDTEEVALDADMLRLLLAIDEHRSLEEISQTVQLNAAQLQRALAALLKRGLIEPVWPDTPRLDHIFREALRINLSKAVGPMAEILMEDAAAEMNLDLERVPVDQAADLITSISYEIPDEENRLHFKKAMLRILGKLTAK